MTEDTPCIEAPPGFRDVDGYAQKWYQGRTWRAHRLAWMLANGPIPAGMLVCHRCDWPPCINLAHLFLGTIADNNADMKAKGRHARGARSRARLYPESIMRGESHPNAKLSVADVLRIRVRYAEGETQVAIGRSLGVTKHTIHLIIRGRTWTHVPT